MDAQILVRDVGFKNLQRTPHRGVNIKGTNIEIDFSLGDSGEIKNVVDQTRLELDVATNDFYCALELPLALTFCSSNSTPARTGVRGVRNSWPSTARNLSLARFAASASARASRSRSRFRCCSSACLYAVTS